MRPVVAATVEAVRRAVVEARQRGLSIGFVPTMGALHEGHARLLRTARKETGFVVVSLFVNPTQFGPHEDFQRYPRPLEQDLQLCDREGADLAFVPEVTTLYPPDFRTYVEVTGWQDVLSHTWDLDWRADGYDGLPVPGVCQCARRCEHTERGEGDCRCYGSEYSHLFSSAFPPLSPRRWAGCFRNNMARAFETFTTWPRARD